MPWTIPDDPIVACIQRTGYPPWYFGHRDDYYDEEETDDEDDEADSDDEEESDAPEL